MNLYRIDVRHAGPKSSNDAIQCFLVSGDDENVYEWLKFEGDRYYSDIYLSWSDHEDDPDCSDSVYDDEYNVIGEESFKEQIVRLRGDINWDYFDFSDLYYGKKQYGWELLGEICQLEYAILKKLLGDSLFVDEVAVNPEPDVK